MGKPTLAQSAPSTVSFHIAKEHIRAHHFDEHGRKFTIYHMYPTLADWQGGIVPDEVNPRSHDANMLTGPIVRDIEKTILESPQDFILASRGATLLGESVEYNNQKNLVSISFRHCEGNTAIHGVADGATSDAVIAKVQKQLLGDTKFEDVEWSAMPASLQRARFHLEVIVGLQDRDDIAVLSQGRNTSRQVKGWSLADFKGDFDWLKKILERGRFADRIGYEENADKPVKILEVISLLTLFHRYYDEQSSKSPTVAYSARGTMSGRLADPKYNPGYRELEPLIPDILELHDYVVSHFIEAFKEARPGSKLGQFGPNDNKTFPLREHALALTDLRVEREIPDGVVYPILAAMRVLISRKGKILRWKVPPKKFWDNHGSEMVGKLMEVMNEFSNNAQTIGKKAIAYTMLYDRATNLLARQLLNDSE